MKATWGSFPFFQTPFLPFSCIMQHTETGREGKKERTLVLAFFHISKHTSGKKGRQQQSLSQLRTHAGSHGKGILAFANWCTRQTSFYEKLGHCKSFCGKYVLFSSGLWEFRGGLVSRIHWARVCRGLVWKLLRGGELFFWGGVQEGERVKFSLPFFCLVGLDFQRKHTVELIFQTC